MKLFSNYLSVNFCVDCSKIVSILYTFCKNYANPFFQIESPSAKCQKARIVRFLIIDIFRKKS